ncbi:P-loop containing nucleoside triphosphate hydrolase protein [Cristinia sonorae]|uniref:P-loop containing nucleoside triphosphate hydrolase protein n=1 Tax=Cristinia sonorae TaxID=1940300 RepID=A0A8K0UQU7_9AGAR|nr:P-loop containing nucleoside triphosphate hydrolase protein [Cristinia sonorae]
MDSSRLLQETFTIAKNMLVNLNPNTTATLFTNETIATPPSTENIPALVNALLTNVLSFSAFQDWVKLFALGSVLAALKQVGSEVLGSVVSVKDYLVDCCWITASFQEHDATYNWMMHWLSQNPKWSKARMVDVTTREFLSGQLRSDDEDESEEDKLKTRYLPTMSEPYSLWYKGTYIRVIREITNVTRNQETLRLEIFALRRSVLDDLVATARKACDASMEKHISLYAATSYGEWNHCTSRPKRAMESIILDPGLKETLLDDMRDFIASRRWYEDRGIPFRRGYLLHGAPGAGKTSLIHAVASELDLDVYILSLSRSGMDDDGLQELFSDLPRKCIVLMEDIDAAFRSRQGVTVEMDTGDSEGKPQVKEEEEDGSKEDAKSESDSSSSSGGKDNGVTLSGLLNALDGVAAQEGRILFATTNCYWKLDPALSRPGRMDVHVEFRLASRYQAEELYKRFYLPTAAEAEEAIAGEKSGEASTSKQSSHASSPSPESDSQVSAPSTAVLSLFSGPGHHKRAPQLTHEQILSLASRFADAIPEFQCSMGEFAGVLADVQDEAGRGGGGCSWMGRRGEGEECEEEGGVGEGDAVKARVGIKIIFRIYTQHKNMYQ